MEGRERGSSGNDAPFSLEQSLCWQPNVGRQKESGEMSRDGEREGKSSVDGPGGLLGSFSLSCK